MKYPPITLEFLKSKDACTSQLDLFQTHFGEGPVPLTEEVFIKFASEFDISWAANNLLNSEDFVECNKVCASASAEYKKVLASAYAEYTKVCDSAYDEYKKVRASARAEYQKVCALTFLRLYKA